MLLAIDIGNSSTSVGVFDITDKASPKMISDFKLRHAIRPLMNIRLFLKIFSQEALRIILKLMLP